MLNENRIHVILIDSFEALVHLQMLWGDKQGGSAGIVSAMTSALEVVAVFNQKDVNGNGETTGPFWDEYSGRSAISVQETSEGINIAQYDIFPETGDTQEALNDGSIRSKLNGAAAAKTATGKGSHWNVFEDGQGSLYIAKVEEARTLVGWPT